MTATRHTPFPAAKLISTALALLLLSIAPTAAQAWYSGGYNTPYYGYGQSHHGSHDYRQGYGHRYGHSSYRRGHDYGYGSGRSYASHDTASQDCHATSKIGYLDGVKGKIGGTMCYDSYGDAFVVPGSRYVIDRY